MPLFRRQFRCWSCGAKLPNGERLDCEDCDRMLDQANTDLEMRRRQQLCPYCRSPHHDRFDHGKPGRDEKLQQWIEWIPKINADIDAVYAAQREQGVIAELRRELEGIAL